MSYYWIPNMGHSQRDGKPPQTMYRYLGANRPPRNVFAFNPGTFQPQHPNVWHPVGCNDPYGHRTGSSPDWIVGRYGNWWGAQWSGGKYRGYDGIGPTETPYLDELDQVAQEHDIECWLAGEAKRNPSAGIRSNDVFRIENVWNNGRVVHREFRYVNGVHPHLNARRKVDSLRIQLRKRLKKSIILYGLLKTHNPHSTRGLSWTGRQLSANFHHASRASIAALGLAQVRVDLADLLRTLRRPDAENIPLSKHEVRLIVTRIRKFWQGRGDPRIAELLNAFR